MQGDQHRQHISGQFNAELDAMKNHLLEMGGLVEQQLGRAMSSLLARDSGEAQEVVRADQQINEMELQIDEECSRILARRQPAASDLRLVLAVAKSTTDLERIGDEATRIARQATKLSELPPSSGTTPEFRLISGHVGNMLRQALDSFARLDVARAIEVVLDADAVNAEHDAAMDSLLRLMKNDAGSIDGVVHEMWALRGLERVGAHATNIAEQVIYLVRGRDVRHMKPGELQSLLKVDKR
ncbi:phosphate signaling complex protein PhoU [Congregibacter litoralis]|uniref:Phosphate-specific transport system accessory protein PhoU n=1 Tax=Congregibacter litoralis KT71 TaxID=314285 RepID=A4A3L4_9GAMM|nr:phosphate signaling complex protein PhoU [Congregibacter litoralis]EAQ99287.1 phosphate uptake regulator, PhoU [Congregibacter litoralis KT71]